MATYSTTVSLARGNLDGWTELLSFFGRLLLFCYDDQVAAAAAAVLV